jgi:hypothetical protein
MAKMNANLTLTKDYRKNDYLAAQKTNPISSKAKMNANVFITKDYENETAFRLEQNKPNQTLSWAQSNGPISVKKCQNKLLLCFGVENDIILAVVTSDWFCLKQRQTWKVNMGANGFDRMEDGQVACPGRRLAWLIIRQQILSDNYQLRMAA